MKKKWITLGIKYFFILMILFGLLSCYTTTTQSTNVKVSDERINVDWSDSRTAPDIRDEVMVVVQSNLRRYRYYHVGYTINANSATSYWRNQIHFIEYRNPHEIIVQMFFNYFTLFFHFSNEQLRSYDDGVLYRASPYFSGSNIRVFTRNVNDVLSRLSLSMRGKTFVNNEKYQWDMFWIEALKFID